MTERKEEAPADRPRACACYAALGGVEMDTLGEWCARANAYQQPFEDWRDWNDDMCAGAHEVLRKIVPEEKQREAWQRLFVDGGAA